MRYMYSVNSHFKIKKFHHNTLQFLYNLHYFVRLRASTADGNIITDWVEIIVSDLNSKKHERKDFQLVSQNQDLKNSQPLDSGSFVNSFNVNLLFIMCVLL